MFINLPQNAQYLKLKFPSAFMTKFAYEKFCFESVLPGAAAVSIWLVDCLYI